MMDIDQLLDQVYEHQLQLLEEAERARLVAGAPSDQPAAGTWLAAQLRRIADRLDAPEAQPQAG